MCSNQTDSRHYTVFINSLNIVWIPKMLLFSQVTIPVTDLWFSFLSFYLRPQEPQQTTTPLPPLLWTRPWLWLPPEIRSREEATSVSLVLLWNANSVNCHWTIITNSKKNICKLASLSMKLACYFGLISGSSQVTGKRGRSPGSREQPTVNPTRKGSPEKDHQSNKKCECDIFQHPWVLIAVWVLLTIESIHFMLACSVKMAPFQF